MMREFRDYLKFLYSESVSERIFILKLIDFLRSRNYNYTDLTLYSIVQVIIYNDISRCKIV